MFSRITARPGHFRALRAYGAAHHDLLILGAYVSGRSIFVTAIVALVVVIGYDKYKERRG